MILSEKLLVHSLLSEKLKMKSEKWREAVISSQSIVFSPLSIVLRRIAKHAVLSVAEGTNNQPKAEQ
ncbi:hypothetical protein BKI52_14855 [marine bacterium AO1-C]|nr:hypothetical protein BKI52_14855 [marine bacterium AO1-C]